MGKTNDRCITRMVKLSLFHIVSNTALNEIEVACYQTTQVHSEDNTD